MIRCQPRKSVVIRGLVILALALGMLSPGVVLAQSVLKATAEAMSPDSWAILATNGIDNTTLLTGGASGFLIGDADTACWDPMTQRLHFIGMDHEASVFTRHIVYNAATNTWLRLADPPFPNSGQGNFINHGFDGTTCDVQGRILYRRNIGTTDVYAYNMNTQTWTNLGPPPLSIIAYTAALAGLAWNPDRGRIGQLMVAQLEAGTSGVLATYDPDTRRWDRLPTTTSLIPGFLDQAFFAHYNAVHKVTIFGNGSNPRLVDTSATTVTTGAAYPNCRPGYNRNGLVHADPATGNFIMLCGNAAASWHTYNPITNVWITKPTPGSVTNHILNFPSVAGTWPTWGTIGLGLSDHGVMFYVKCNGSSPSSCAVRLYKGGTVAPNPSPAPPIGVQVK